MQDYDDWGAPPPNYETPPAKNTSGAGVKTAIGIAVGLIVLALVGVVGYVAGTGGFTSGNGDDTPVTVVEMQTLPRQQEKLPETSSEEAVANSCSYSTFVSANRVTTDGFAANVYDAFMDNCHREGSADVEIIAYSPSTKIFYTMKCSGRDIVECRGGDNAVVRIS